MKTLKSQEQVHQKSFDVIEKRVTGQIWTKIVSGKFFLGVFTRPLQLREFQFRPNTHSPLTDLLCRQHRSIPMGIVVNVVEAEAVG